MHHGFKVSATEYEFGAPPERGYAPMIRRAINWVPAISGTLTPSDMGADYDVHEADITIIAPSAECATLCAMLAEYRGAQIQYQSPAGVYPFGPHIDSVSGFVYVRVNNFQQGGRISRTSPYWQVHVRMRLDQTYTPVSSTLPPLLGTKYATPRVAYPRWMHPTAAGRGIAAGRGGVAYGCQISADALRPAVALQAVEWALWVRGGTFTYTPPTGLLPFGPDLSGSSFTVRLVDFTLSKYKPHLWAMNLDLVRA